MTNSVLKILGIPNDAQSSSVPGCGVCPTKNSGNCNSHLAAAVVPVVQGFIDATIMFDRSNQQHVGLVAAILAEDIKEGDQHVAYEIPTEPVLRNWFFDLITKQVKEGLSAR